MNATAAPVYARPWLSEYPKGIPADIDPDAYTSLNVVLQQACQRYANQAAFSCMGKTLSFSQLDRLARDFAAYLQGELKLTRGDRVAIMLPNILQYPIAICGILRAGLVVVNCNPLYTPRELEHQLKDSGAKAIVVIENFATTLEQCIAKTSVKHVITTQLGDLLGFPKSFIVNWVVKHKKKLVPVWNLPGAVSFKSALAKGQTLPLNEPAVVGSDIAFLQYTGGTTGVSKGAILTHRNLVANVQQVGCWVGIDLKEGAEVIMQPLPLYHIFALNVSINFMSRGAETILIPNPRDMGSFIKELKSRRWTVLTGVNTLFNGLLHHPEFANVDFSALKLTIGGGMAVQRAVAEKWKVVTGNTLIEAYGLTETSPGVTGNPLGLAEFNGCIGLPFPSTIVSIRDDDENLLGVGEAGEICIEGPQVMQGYWQRPDESANVFCKDGAFKSGDIGVMDERGYFKIIDRKKDMILVSGFNVYPNEIEDVIAMCPGVFEVCAVSMPDEKSTEAVRVVVVKKDAGLTKETIIAFCKERLTGYKMPKLIEFWSELPKTNVGKVLRRAVRDTPIPK